jgi:peptide/nickel transport system ATP-binding protein
MAPVPANAPLLEIDRLSVSYFTRAGEVPAVIDFSLTLGAGEAVGLVGESGCGKSTVAMAVMRYLGRGGRIVGGSIRYKGRELTTMREEELRRLRGAEIAMVYQEPMASLNPSMKIGDQLVEVPMCHEGIGRCEAQERAAGMLEAVRLPDPARVMASYPHQLSGGQQQRVVIAMALLSNPSLLLLDEPTTALDVTVEAGIVALVAEISQRFGTGMLYISHNLGLIRETCDRLVVMYSGQAVETGTIGQVFAGNRHPYTRGLFNCIALPSADRFDRPLTPIRGNLPLPHQRPPGCTFGPRCDFFQAGRCDAGPIPMAPAEEPGHLTRCLRWNEIPWGEAARGAVPFDASEPGAPVLEVQDLTKHYEVAVRGGLAAIVGGGTVRTVRANDNLSFTANEGETVAIVGESGCGKSTFAKVLTGLETATDGRLVFMGDDVAQTDVQSRSPDQIGALQMIFQNPFDTLNPSQTVGAQIARVIRKFDIERDPQKIRSRMLDLLDLVKLPRDFARRRPRQLSGGQKQRIGIARAFAAEPKTVVADEPVSALDVSVAAAVTGLLLDLQRRNRTTLIFISHDLGIVRYLADRVVVMYLGQIMEQGTAQQIFEPPYHPYTEALLAAAPVADTAVDKRRIILEGALPSPLDPPKGCPFATRCPRRLGAICDEERPPVVSPAAAHQIACHIPLSELRKVAPVFTIGSEPDLAAE